MADCRPAAKFETYKICLDPTINSFHEWDYSSLPFSLAASKYFDGFWKTGRLT